ncbi:hypothetical protein ACFLWI_05350 [Chloroflexota bacterium]
MVTKNKAKKDITKVELVSAVQRKFKDANPMIRRLTLTTKELMRLPKKELQRQLRKGHVVRSGKFKGDITFT